MIEYIILDSRRESNLATFMDSDRARDTEGQQELHVTGHAVGPD